MPHRLITVGYVGAILGGAWLLNHASEQRSQAKLRSSVNGCLAIGNPARALDHIDARGRSLALHEQLEPILDCSWTYMHNNGNPVPLSLKSQRLYVRYVRGGLVPRIRPDGSVTAR